MDETSICIGLREIEAGTGRYGVPAVVCDIIPTVGNQLQEDAVDADRVGDVEAATAFRTVAEANRVGAQVQLKHLHFHLNKHQDGIN